MSCEFCREKPEQPIDLSYFDYGGLVWKSLEPRFCPMCGEALTVQGPLTLDELREMDGEPMWVMFYEDSYEDDEYEVKIKNPSCSVINTIKPCANGLLNNIVEFTDGMKLNLLYYGSDWIAYRRPPKERK